jgi:hypothetical protein
VVAHTLAVVVLVVIELAQVLLVEIVVLNHLYL